MYVTIYLPCILPVNSSFYISSVKKFGISISIKYLCTSLNMGLNNKMYWSKKKNLTSHFYLFIQSNFTGAFIYLFINLPASILSYLQLKSKHHKIVGNKIKFVYELESIQRIFQF